MRNPGMSVAALVLIAAFPGCRREKDPELTPEQQMNAIMAATSPFAEAEIRMDAGMTAAVGVDAGDSWVRKMTEHHKGAIAIAKQMLAMEPDRHVAAMARSTIADATPELADLQRLVRQGRPDRASADLYQPAVDRMHQAMMAAGGSAPGETYHLKMLEQHRGAVAMSDVALAHGVAGTLKVAVERAKAHHLEQVHVIEAMLRNRVSPRATNGPAGLERASDTGPARPAAWQQLRIRLAAGAERENG